MKTVFSFHLMSLTLFFFFVLPGCAMHHHYTKVEGDSLSLFYSAQGAKMVYFASSLDNFQYHTARLVNKSVWQVTVPLQKEFEYFYIVDGVVTQPPCNNTVLDDFGAKNCLFLADM